MTAKKTQLQLRITEAEKKSLKDIAEELDTDVSSYIRQCVPELEQSEG